MLYKMQPSPFLHVVSTYTAIMVARRGNLITSEKFPINSFTIKTHLRHGKYLQVNQKSPLRFLKLESVSEFFLKRGILHIRQKNKK